MRSTLAGSKVLTKRRVKKHFCIVAAMGRPFGRKSIARSESVFDLNRRVTLAGESRRKRCKRGPLAVERILGQAVKGSNGDEKRA